MNFQSALTSHSPLSFAATPLITTETPSQTAARLQFKSQWKLNSEMSREEPCLRKVLAHTSVYSRAKAYTQSLQASTAPDKSPEASELSTYIQHRVPSFEEFRAALALQLQTITQVRLAAQANCQQAEEYDSDDDDETDSDYDSYDGDCWSDEDDNALSDDSLTDDQESGGEESPCTSPTCASTPGRYDDQEDDIWAIRPKYSSPNFDPRTGPA
jgi:hypothetical protein